MVTPTGTPTAAPTPQGISVSQDGNTTGGGFTVTLTGSGFLPGAQIWVDFGSGYVPLTTVVAGSGTLTAVAPPHAAGTFSVKVANPGGAFASFVGVLSYVAPPGTLSLVMAPLPAKRGDPVCLFPSDPLSESWWTVFGTDQQVVARLHSGDPRPCFTGTGGLARGVYLVRIKAHSVSGQDSTVVKQMVIE